MTVEAKEVLLWARDVPANGSKLSPVLQECFDNATLEMVEG